MTVLDPSPLFSYCGMAMPVVVMEMMGSEGDSPVVGEVVVTTLVVVEHGLTRPALVVCSMEFWLDLHDF